MLKSEKSAGEYIALILLLIVTQQYLILFLRNNSSIKMVTPLNESPHNLLLDRLDINYHHGYEHNNDCL